MEKNKTVFTSESATAGHPDKMSDQVSDAILDASLMETPFARVAAETMLATDLVVMAGEIAGTTMDGRDLRETIDFEGIAREMFRRVGYDEAALGFDPDRCEIQTRFDPQSPDIARGVDRREMGAGDQGMMFGFACTETADLMPMPVWLAHRMAERLAAVRRSGVVPGLRPDGKTQISIEYSGFTPVRLSTVLISTQHMPGMDLEGEMKPALVESVIMPLIPPSLDAEGMRVLVNPTGVFEEGGPKADTGLTGRKIVADTYGGMARHGGGAFSGKDPSKVDRSAAYAARWICKHIVASGAATRVEMQVAYAIGMAKPLSMALNTYGTHTVEPRKILEAVREIFDLRPAEIIRDLDLRRPIYLPTATYGHFGRVDKDFTWEATPRVEALRSLLGL